jgi:hypothetical protein
MNYNMWEMDPTKGCVHNEVVNISSNPRKSIPLFHRTLSSSLPW